MQTCNHFLSTYCVPNPIHSTSICLIFWNPRHSRCWWGTAIYTAMTLWPAPLTWERTQTMAPPSPHIWSVLHYLGGKENRDLKEVVNPVAILYLSFPRVKILYEVVWREVIKGKAVECTWKLTHSNCNLSSALRMPGLTRSTQQAYTVEVSTSSLHSQIKEQGPRSLNSSS